MGSLNRFAPALSMGQAVSTSSLRRLSGAEPFIGGVIAYHTRTFCPSLL